MFISITKTNTLIMMDCCYEKKHENKELFNDFVYMCRAHCLDVEIVMINLFCDWNFAFGGKYKKLAVSKIKCITCRNAFTDIHPINDDYSCYRNLCPFVERIKRKMEEMKGKETRSIFEIYDKHIKSYDEVCTNAKRCFREEANKHTHLLANYLCKDVIGIIANYDKICTTCGKEYNEWCDDCEYNYQNATFYREYTESRVKVRKLYMKEFCLRELLKKTARIE